ncbi:MAG: lipopolysaccharide heptosyltransferase I [Thermoanaerobaculia bacterium]
MKLLALRLSALGDVIHTLPAVAFLRDGGADVSWVVEAAYAEMVEIVGGVRAIPVTMKRWGRHLVASREAMASARKAMRGHDVSVDFQGLVKSAALGWIARAPVRYGFDRNAVREKLSLLFTNRHVAVDRAKHVVDWNLQLAAAIDQRSDSRPIPPLDFTRFAANGFDEYRNRVVILPGAGRPNKQWPLERFAAVARMLGDRALVVWGPREEHLARAVGAPMAPPTNLRELTTILGNASLVIGGDTGPLHLAAALGVPVVGLYGPTDPRRNGPYGQLQNCVSSYSESRTLEAIAVDSVVTMVERTLDR